MPRLHEHADCTIRRIRCTMKNSNDIVVVGFFYRKCMSFKFKVYRTQGVKCAVWYTRCIEVAYQSSADVLKAGCYSNKKGVINVGCFRGVDKVINMDCSVDIIVKVGCCSSVDNVINVVKVMQTMLLTWVVISRWRH